MAIVVVRVIASQFQRDSNGTALSPPMRIFPNGDSAAQIHVKTKINAAMANPLEKTSNIASLISVTISRNATGLARLAVTKTVNTNSGNQNTTGRTFKNFTLQPLFTLPKAALAGFHRLSTRVNIRAYCRQNMRLRPQKGVAAHKPNMTSKTLSTQLGLLRFK